MLLSRRPFVGIALVFSAGILLSRILPPFCFYLALSSLPVCFAVYLYGRKRISKVSQVLFMASFHLGVLALAGTLAQAHTLLPSNHVSHFINHTVILEGNAVDDSRKTRYGQKVTFESTTPLTGTIVLYFSDSLQLLTGDRLKARIALKNLPEKAPGYTQYLKSKGILATGSVKDSLELLGHGQGIGPVFANLRQAIGERIDASVPGSSLTGLSKAMLLGDRSDLAGTHREAFQVAGLSHILAISGMHVGIIYLFLQWLMLPLCATRRGVKARTAILLLVLIVYMLLTGCSPAVCRTVLMLGLLEVAKVFFFQRDSLNLLGFSAVFLLLLNPTMLFQLGFQLSYAAVAGILLIQGPLTARIQKALPWMPHKVASALSVCLAAQIATAPLIWIAFGQFPTWFLLSNLIILPFASLAVGLGFAGLMVCWIPGIGEILFGLQDTVLSWVVQLSEWVTWMPAAVVERLSFNDPGFVVVFVMFHVLAMVLYRRELRAWAMRIQRRGWQQVPRMMRQPVAAMAGLISFGWMTMGLV